MLICILAFVLGVCLALFLPIVIPQGLMQSFGLIVLDILMFTVFSVNARLKKTLNIKIFISGFIITAVIAVGAAFIGEKLDLDIYTVCVILFVAAVFKGCYDIFNYYTGHKNNG